MAMSALLGAKSGALMTHSGFEGHQTVWAAKNWVSLRTPKCRPVGGAWLPKLPHGSQGLPEGGERRALSGGLGPCNRRCLRHRAAIPPEEEDWSSRTEGDGVCDQFGRLASQKIHQVCLTSKQARDAVGRLQHSSNAPGCIIIISFACRSRKSVARWSPDDLASPTGYGTPTTPKVTVKVR